MQLIFWGKNKKISNKEYSNMKIKDHPYLFSFYLGWCALVFMFLCTFLPLIYIAMNG